MPIPWARRIWALPFLTMLVPSERWAHARGVKHTTLVDGARQMLLQIARWLPDRRIVAVAGSSFLVIDLLDAVRARVCMVTRLRLDARLFAPAAPPKGDWPAAANGGSVADARTTAGRSGDMLAAASRHGLVWHRRAAR